MLGISHGKRMLLLKFRTPHLLPESNLMVPKSYLHRCLHWVWPLFLFFQVSDNTDPSVFFVHALWLLTQIQFSPPFLSSECYFYFCLHKLTFAFPTVYNLYRRRQWHPTPVLFPGKSHGWRSLVGCSPGGCKESDMTERLPFHFSLSCIGEGNGNPLQCSCLENPRDRGAWWVAIYGFAQDQTWLKQLGSRSSSMI